MSRLFTSASSEYLTAASTPVTAVPLTMACWFRSSSATLFQGLMTVGQAGANEAFRIAAAGNTAGDPIRIVSVGSGTTRFADSSTGYSANVWAHACGVFTSTTSRAVYINGGSAGTNVQSSTPTGLNQVEIGRVDGTSPGSYMEGRIAEAGLWNVALDVNEIAALARGISPRSVRPGSLVGYWPIWGIHSPEIDLVPAGRTLTVTGTSKADHAPVQPFSRTLYVPTTGEIAAAATSNGHYYRHIRRYWQVGVNL
jgi:hypothetical protein